MGLHQDFSFILGNSNFMLLSLIMAKNHTQLKSLVNPRGMLIWTLTCPKIRFHRNFSTFLRFHKNVHYPYRNHCIWPKMDFYRHFPHFPKIDFQTPNFFYVPTRKFFFRYYGYIYILVLYFRTKCPR